MIANCTVYSRPLGVCDFRSLDASRDLIASDNILPHTVGETYNVLHNKRHQWYYLSDQMPNEILIFKSFDSKVGVAISKSYQSVEFDPSNQPKRVLTHHSTWSLHLESRDAGRV